MNERIKELADQAELTIRTSKGTYMSHPEFNKKFAELIVRMCADYADMAQDAGCEYAGDYVAEAMGYGEKEGITAWRAK